MIKSLSNSKPRCFGNTSEEYSKYHDEEWGIPVYDDKILLEMLILEGAQAGLSWETVLNKRQGYRDVFYNFDVHKIANMSDDKLELLRSNEKIIRNRLKIYSARTNARVFIKIQEEFGSFSKYLWGFVDNKPIINHWNDFSEVPLSTDISDDISQDLKKRGMKFVGSTIVYAYMQAVGLVKDHLTTCWKYKA